MWVIQCILLLAASSLSVNGESDACEVGMTGACDVSLFPEDFPDTVEELKDNCRDLSTLGNCILRYREDCDEDQTIASHFRNVMDFIDDACKEESSVFEVISSNIDCITPVARTAPDFCLGHTLSKETQIKLLERVKLHLATSKHLSEETQDCVESFWRVTCLAKTVGISCGEEVENAVSDILENTDYNIKFCSDEVLDELQQLKEFFESIIIEEHNIENAIRRRK